PLTPDCVEGRPDTESRSRGRRGCGAVRLGEEKPDVPDEETVTCVHPSDSTVVPGLLKRTSGPQSYKCVSTNSLAQ
ncbi:hypothetical protein WMY93_031156, partial [Mugilogobius chulae]